MGPDPILNLALTKPNSPFTHNRLTCLTRYMMSEEQMNRLFKHISQEVGSVRDALNEFKAEVYHRFELIDQRFDAIERRLDEHDAQFKAIDVQFKAIDAQFKGINVQFKEINAQFRAIDAQFNAIHAQFAENKLIQNEILNAIGQDDEIRDRRITKLEKHFA